MFVFDVFEDRWSSLVPQKLRAQKVASQPGSAQTAGQPQDNSVIAWRYNQQRIRLKELDNFVSADLPRLDLSKAEDALANPQFDALVHRFNINELASYADIIEKLADGYQSSLRDEQDTATRKVLLTNLFSCFCKLE